MILLAGTGPGWSWNLISDVQTMFAYQFMVSAYEAGTIVAITAALVGWFMVLRKQTFAGHTLAMVAFPGAAAATLIGVSISLGYFTFCVAAALVIAVAPHGKVGGGGFSQESAVTGTVQALALASGFLFIALYKGFLEGISSLLFGTFLGITSAQVTTLLVVAVVVIAVLAVIGRPLLFASIDGDVAAAAGVPVRGLGVAFLVLLGVAAAATSQITGALLVFALLVMPAAAAQRLTARPALSLALAVVIGLVVTWGSLAVAFFTPYPLGFWVTSIAFGLYALTHLGAALAGWGRGRSRRDPVSVILRRAA
ncbi:MAG: metal ABC transporter permease [Thermoleophilia bacterium]